MKTEEQLEVIKDIRPERLLLETGQLIHNAPDIYSINLCRCALVFNDFNTCLEIASRHNARFISITFFPSFLPTREVRQRTNCQGAQ